MGVLGSQHCPLAATSLGMDVKLGARDFISSYLWLLIGIVLSWWSWEAPTPTPKKAKRFWASGINPPQAP